MRYLLAAIALSVQLALSVDAASGRTWTDATGEYQIDAELISFDDEVVVLKRDDHELAALPIAKLSEADREFLKSNEAKEASAKSLEAPQEWKLRNGQVVKGNVVDFADRDVVIDRRRGRIFVNDRLMNNLPEFYQQIVPEIVAEQGKLPQANGRALRRWLIDQGDQPHAFHVQGVVIEAENGDEFAVPFFLFSDEDLKLLRPGWDEWLDVHAKKDYAAEDDHAFLLRSLAAARQHDQEIKREIALMQLNMQAVQAGVTSMWEVTLYPAVGNGGPPLWVVVTARNNIDAINAALQQHPNYVAGPVRRVSRTGR